MLALTLLPDVLNGVLVPGLAAYGMAGLMLGRRRHARGPGFLRAAPWLAMLVAFPAIVGGLPFVADTPHHRVGEVAAALAFLSMLQPRLPLLGSGLRQRLFGVAAAVLAGFWCLTVPLATALFPLLVALPPTLAAVWRLGMEAEGRTAPAAAPLLPVVALVGIAGVATLDGAPASAALALAGASAHLGAVAQRKIARVRLPPPFIENGLAAGFAVAVAVDAAESGLHAGWAVPLLAFVAWPEIIARRLPFLASKMAKRRRRPVVSLGAASVWVVAVWALASLAVFLDF